MKASYCDIRINRYRDQNVAMRLNPERGTGKLLEVPSITDRESFGFGVRVIVEWRVGFCVFTRRNTRRDSRGHGGSSHGCEG